MEQNKKIKEAPIREQTTIRLPKELYEQLQRKAAQRGDSLNDTMLRIIRLGLEEESRRIASRTPR